VVAGNFYPTAIPRISGPHTSPAPHSCQQRFRVVAVVRRQLASLSTSHQPTHPSTPFKFISRQATNKQRLPLDPTHTPLSYTMQFTVSTLLCLALGANAFSPNAFSAKSVRSEGGGDLFCSRRDNDYESKQSSNRLPAAGLCLVTRFLQGYLLLGRIGGKGSLALWRACPGDASAAASSLIRSPRHLSCWGTRRATTRPSVGLT
jgi:hypothetical protein